jgi:hypothetical protein
MRDREGAAETLSAEAPDYLPGFNSVPFFYAEPGGYDAVILARAQEIGDSSIAFSGPIYIHIGGSALLYELDEPARLIEWPAPRLPDFPGLRRVYLENFVRYIFVRYGVPYVIAIECFDGRARFGKISCRDADKVCLTRCILPVAHRRRRSGTAARTPSIGQLAAPPSSPTVVPETSFRAPAFGMEPAPPITTSIPGSAFPLPRHRPLPARSAS